ncbi:unnamed protein product [Caenorhabditis brenneri]
MSDVPDAKKPRIEVKKENDAVVPKRVNLIDYDGQNMNHYNVILIVENRKFHVSKEHLAKRCPYFDRLFFGNFEENGKNEITLQEIPADDFQLFLECLEGVLEIDDDVVWPVARLADRFEACPLTKKCEKWLLSASKMPAVCKFILGYNHNMENVKVAAIPELTQDDLEEVTKDRVHEQKTMDLLFNRSMAINKELQQQMQQLEQQHQEQQQQQRQQHQDQMQQERQRIQHHYEDLLQEIHRITNS